MAKDATSSDLELAGAPTMIAPTPALLEQAYDAVLNAELPPEVGDPAITARAIQERIRQGSLDDSMAPAESLPSWGDLFADQLVYVCSFHLNRSTFEIQEGPNKGKKGVYAVVELMDTNSELHTVNTGAQNVLTQLVKAWEEKRFPFPAVLEVKDTGTAGRTTQWLRSPAAAA
jgi:hypothetical protein